MDEPKQLIQIKADGTVAVSGQQLKKRLGARAGRYTLIDGPAGLLVLRRKGRGTKITPTRVLMAGEITSRSTVMEIISMISQAAWCGELTIYSGEVRRRLLIDQGALRSATSTVPGERLGQILLSQKAITRKQLSECLKLQSGRRRLGEILMEEGFIDRETLFDSLYRQVETIFTAALLVGEGSFILTTVAEDAIPPAMKVHLPLTKLLMEGVQRIDEMAVYRKHVPRSSLCPVPLRRGSEEQLDEALQPVAGLADGQRNIKQISAELGWGEFKTIKAVYQLVQSGYLELRTPRRNQVETARRLVSEFNRTMRGIYAVVAKHGGNKEMPENLKAWIGSSGLSRYVGEHLGKQCTLDAEEVLRALAELETTKPLPALLKALRDMASFAMVSATPYLPREVEEMLSRVVDKRLDNLRL